MSPFIHFFFLNVGVVGNFEGMNHVLKDFVRRVGRLPISAGTCLQARFLKFVTIIEASFSLFLFIVAFVFWQAQHACCNCYVVLHVGVLVRAMNTA